MSGVVLPTVIPTTSQWIMTDFLDRQLSGDEPAAGGRAELTGPQVGFDDRWLIDHMVVHCPSSTQATLRLYDTQEHPLRLLDGVPDGRFAVADWPAGLQLRPGGTLLAVWTGASDGARGVITLQGRIMRRVTG